MGTDPRRFPAVVLAGTATMVGAAVLAPHVAGANVKYPSGCNDWAYGTANDWANYNCWLGTDGGRYWNVGGYVFGATRAGRTGPHGPTYDAQVATAIKSYQQGKGLGADGIMGTQTWRALGNDLVGCGVTTWPGHVLPVLTYSNFVGGCQSEGPGFYKAQSTANANRWWVKATDTGSVVTLGVGF